MPSADSSPLGSSSKLGSSNPPAPKSGLSKKGSSPSNPNKAVDVPPKAPKRPTTTLPKLPKLPKPKSGWKPPKGTLPGYTPGHPPYHGSGGHLDKGHASSVSSCIHPKGFERLHCQKTDAVVVTLFTVIGLLLAPFLIYMCVRSFKRRMSKRKNRDEENGVELRDRARTRKPDPQLEGRVSDWASNIGVATSTSEETVTLAKKEQTRDRSSVSGPVRAPAPVYAQEERNRDQGSVSGPVRVPSPEYRVRSPSRGRKLLRDEVSGRRRKLSRYELSLGPEGRVSDWALNFGVAINTSGDTVTLAKEKQTRDRSSISGPVRALSPVFQPRVRSPGRGRKRSRDEVSLGSLASSLSSGMIRTARLGQALQDAMVVDVPPSLASSRKNSTRICTSGDVDGSSDGNSSGDGGRDTAEDEWCDCVENNVVDGEEAKSCSRSSGRRSSSRDTRIRRVGFWAARPWPHQEGL